MSNSTTPLKKCTKCGTEYPATAEYFHRDKQKIDGLASSCKTCKTWTNRQYAKQNATKVRDYQKQWYIKHADRRRIAAHKRYQANPQEYYEKSKQWRRDNPEKAKAIDRRWKKKNPEKVKEANRRFRRRNPTYQHQWGLQNTRKLRRYEQQWRERNPEKTRVYNRNRRARKHAAEGSYTAADVRAQFQRQKGRCYYCGCKLNQSPHLPDSKTVDHVVPLTRGGRNSPDNLVIACWICNSSKQDRLPHEWTRGGRLL